MSLELEAAARIAEIDRKYPGLHLKLIEYWSKKENMKKLFRTNVSE